jgi:hypothetical protein
MQTLYFILTAIHIVTVPITGLMWTMIDLNPKSSLRKNFRDIRAVHFGALYLVPWFMGLAYVFERLQIPALHQLPFPVGLGLLVFFSGVGYLLPRSPDVEPFYYWTKGWPMVLAMIGLVCLVIAMVWTAVVIVVFALR